MGRLMAMLLAGATAAAAIPPAGAQTIVDTFRSLRATARQLGGGRHPVGAAPPPAAAPAGQAEDGSMVPAAVVVDDASDTRLEDETIVAGRVASFDVRGFRLGMSPREVGRVADRERFRHRWNDIRETTGTFDLEAARLANRQLGRPIEKSSKVQLKAVQGVDPNGDEVKLEFTLEPIGPRLSRIEYSAKLAGSTRQQTFDALIRKYGRPSTDRREIDVLSWSGSKGPADNSSPGLTAVVGQNGMTLTLAQSVDYFQAARRQLADRAQQFAASRGGGVRF